MPLKETGYRRIFDYKAHSLLCQAGYFVFYLNGTSNIVFINQVTFLKVNAYVHWHLDSVRMTEWLQTDAK